MANTKNGGQESTNRPREIGHSLPPGPLPNKYLHKLGRTNTQTDPYGQGRVSSVPSTKKPDNPTGY